MAAYAEMEEAALNGSWQVHAYRGDATNQAAIRHRKVLAIAGPQKPIRATYAWSEKLRRPLMYRFALPVKSWAGPVVQVLLLHNVFAELLLCWLWFGGPSALAISAALPS